MSKAIYAFVVIGVVALAGIVTCIIWIGTNDDGESGGPGEIAGEYDYHLGKVSEYQVTGYQDLTVYSGTMKVEITAVEGSMVTMKYTYDIYQTTSGNKTGVIVTTTSYTINAAAVEDFQVLQGQESIPTYWGTKATDVWTVSMSGLTMTEYRDQQNEDVAYKMEGIIEGMVLIFNLTATDYLTTSPYVDPTITTQIEIKVTSVRSMWTGDYLAFVNGLQVKSWQLAPGASTTFTYDFTSKMSDGMKAITVSSQSNALGGFQSDSKQIVVGTGIKTSVSLNS